MALVTLGTNANNTLNALKFAANLNDADCGNLAGLIVDDNVLTNGAIITTGNIANGSATITTVGTTAGMKAGQFVFGPGIVSGTAIVSVTATTIVMTKAATATNNGANLFALSPNFSKAFAREGLLYVPRRGTLQILPGDYVGVDASGWPILVSQEAIAYAGTSWTHT